MGILYFLPIQRNLSLDRKLSIHFEEKKSDPINPTQFAYIQMLTKHHAASFVLQKRTSLAKRWTFLLGKVMEKFLNHLKIMDLSFWTLKGLAIDPVNRFTEKLGKCLANVRKPHPSYTEIQYVILPDPPLGKRWTFLCDTFLFKDDIYTTDGN